MTTMKQCVEHLSSEIGARPAGTDEEQLAANFIKDTLLENTNMDVDIEEFESSFNGELFRGVEAALVFLAGMMAILVPTTGFLAVFIALVGCVLFVLDELEIFKLGSYFSKQPSQNVVAKHVPASRDDSRRRSRKIVLITNYDSEKIRPQVKSGFFKYLGQVKYFELGCTVAVFVLLVFRTLIGSSLFSTILMIIGIIGSILPLLAYLFHTTSHYNDGANNNAASVAVMVDVAKRLSTGVYRTAGDTPVIHGRDVAESMGLLSDDVKVEWDAEPNFEDESQGEFAPSESVSRSSESKKNDDTSVSAGSGVDALFGSSSVKTSQKDEKKPISFAQPSVSVSDDKEKGKPAIEFKFEQAQTHAQKPSNAAAPDWFSRGKERAAEEKPKKAVQKGVKRSVYGDALNAANAGAQIAEDKAASDAEAPRTALEKQLEEIHSQIEKSGNAAKSKARSDASAAERVLENEKKIREQELEKQKVKVAKSAESKNGEQASAESKSEVEVSQDTEVDSKSQQVPEAMIEDAEVTLRDTSGDTIAQAPIPVEDVRAEYISDSKGGNQAVVVNNAKSDDDTPVSDVASQIPSLATSSEPEVHIRESKESREPLQKLDNIVGKGSSKASGGEELQPVKRSALESHVATQERMTKSVSGGSPIDERLAAKGIKRTQTLTSKSSNSDREGDVSSSKRDIQLPSLTGAIKAQKAEEESGKTQSHTDDNQKKMNKAASGIMVPSLSNQKEESKDNSENHIVANAGSFGVGEATGTFAPITDDLVAGLTEEETYVLDADDTIFEEHTTESGVVTGPGYVDIPETRTESVFGKIFNRKKKKSEQDDPSLSESFGVDENYDATMLKEERGDWSTFAEDDDEWNGGVAFVDSSEDEEDETGEVAEIPEEKVYPREEVYNFADNDITTEVWCVALGAQYATHAGLNNFMAKHKDELKGSIFVVLDGMGCGATKLIETQGVYKRHSMTARMKRIARSSAKNVGVDLESEKMTWCDSLAANIANCGFSTIHLAGYEADRPALLSSEEDVADNVDETICQENANLVMEIVRSI